jgi:hypothetical protein
MLLTGTRGQPLRGHGLFNYIFYALDAEHGSAEVFYALDAEHGSAEVAKLKK